MVVLGGCCFCCRCYCHYCGGGCGVGRPCRRSVVLFLCARLQQAVAGHHYPEQKYCERTCCCSATVVVVAVCVVVVVVFD